MNSLIILFGTLIIGVVLRATGRLTAREGQVLSAIVFNVTLPAAGFLALVHTSIASSLLVLPAIGLLVPIILLPIAAFVSRAGNPPGGVRGVVVASATVANLGYFAYPIFQTYFGDRGLSRVALFDVGNTIAAYTITYSVSHAFAKTSDTSATISLKLLSNLLSLFRSVPVWAVAAGTVWSIAHFSLPAWFEKLLVSIAAANSPLVLLTLASFLTIHISHIGQIFEAVAIRMGGGALMGWLLALAFHLSAFDQFVAAAAAGMPVGMTVLIYSVTDDLDAEFAAALVTASILVGIGVVVLAFPP